MARRPRPAPPRRTARALGAEEIKGARERLGWDYPPFVIPEDVKDWWRGVGARGADMRKAWEARLEAQPADKRAEFLRRQAGKLPADLGKITRRDLRRLPREKRQARDAPGLGRRRSAR